jgi:hypothetical protein
MANVTEGEFQRWMKHISDSLVRIEDLQRVANGKTAAHGEAIAVISERLAKIEREDEAIESTVKLIRDHGCSQLHNHEAVARTLVAAGVETPSVVVPSTIPHPSQWSKRAKVATGVGVGVALWPAIAEIAKLLYTLFSFIHQGVR